MRSFKIARILLIGALTLVGCAGTQVSQTPMPSSPTPVAATLTPGAPTSAGHAPTPIYGQSAGEVRTPISVRLILSHAPRLEESARVTLVITSTLDASGATAAIVLPPGAVATDGALTWAGDLQAQQPQQLQATIKFVQEGNWTLTDKALAAARGRDVWDDMAVIYLHITREAGQVGFPPEPNAPHGAGRSTPPAATPITPEASSLPLFETRAAVVRRSGAQA